ncbi:MAG TPA: efflux RND transporter periplasmic adaptor subunit [Nevskiaceae bacterium]|nr:efflux RND transporter periplasmic adaptor subunit [Nevskiaceae bacterium]
MITMHCRAMGAWCGILAAAVLLAACSGKPALPPVAATTPHDITLTAAQQRSLKLITVQPTAYHTTITTTGVVDWDRNHSAVVLAPFSGSVTRVLVRLGAHVTSGEALAEVASPDFTAAAGAYRKAVVTAKAADTVAANDQALFARQAISARDNAQAQAAAADADAARAVARQTLVALHVDAKYIDALRAGRPMAGSAGVIRAPISGTVVAKSIAPGETLAAGSSPCFKITDTSRLWVIARLFGDAATRVQVGDAATVEPGDPSVQLSGTVTRIGAAVDPATGAVTARVTVSDRKDVLKRHMYVSVDIHPGQARRGLLAPVSAVLRNAQDLPFVYVATQDDHYARQRVTLGPRVGSRFVIRQGVRAGDRVVAEGGIFLRFIQAQ